MLGCSPLSLTALLLLHSAVAVAGTALAEPTLAPSWPATNPHQLAPGNNQLNELAARQLISSAISSSVVVTATASSAAAGTTSVSIPATAGVGGMTITQPAATASVSYYKIASGNLITFGWNLTSLYVTPTSLTFEARCSANSNTYPVGTVSAVATQIVWDPWAYELSAGAVPFAQASYTLRVADERGFDAASTAGYFDGSAVAVDFAMYSPAAYTSLADGWTCSTCSFGTRLSGIMSSPLIVAIPLTAAAILIGGAGVFNY